MWSVVEQLPKKGNAWCRPCHFSFKYVVGELKRESLGMDHQTPHQSNLFYGLRANNSSVLAHVCLFILVRPFVGFEFPLGNEQCGTQL